MLALVVLAVLALLAVVIVSVATSSKWTEFQEFSNNRAFYSADAAGEAAVNWIRFQTEPPGIIDVQNRVFAAGGFTTLAAGQQYRFDVIFVRTDFRPGWSLEYKDYEYRIVANGASVQQSEAGVEVRARRVFKEGY